MNKRRSFDIVPDLSLRTSTRKSASKSNNEVRTTRHANQSPSKENVQVSEIFYPDFLHHIVKKDSFITQLSVISNDSCTLEEITEPDTFDLEFELMKLDTYLDKDVAVLKVKDGTICPSSLMCFPTSSSWKELEQRILENPLYRSNEPIVDLLLYNSSFILFNLKEFSYYTMKNVTVVKAIGKKSLIMCANGKHAYLTRCTKIDNILRKINSKNFRELENKYFQSINNIETQKNKNNDSPSSKLEDRIIVKGNEFIHRPSDASHTNEIISPRKLRMIVDDNKSKCLRSYKEIRNNSYESEKDRKDKSSERNKKPNEKNTKAGNENKKKECMLKDVKKLKVDSQSQLEDSRDKDNIEGKNIRENDIFEGNISVTSRKSERRMSSRLLKNSTENIGKKNCMQNNDKWLKRNFSSESEDEISSEERKVERLNSIDKGNTPVSSKLSDTILPRKLRSMVKGNKESKILKKDVKQLKINISSETEQEFSNEKSKIKRPSNIIKGKDCVTSEISNKMSTKLKDIIESNKNNKFLKKDNKHFKRNILSDSEEAISVKIRKGNNIENCEESKTTSFDNSIEDKCTVTLKANKTRMSPRNVKATLGLHKNIKITQTCARKCKRNIFSESEEEERSEGNEESEFMEVNDFHESKSSPEQKNNEKPTRKLRSKMNENTNKKCTDNSTKNLKRRISLELGDTSDEDRKEIKTKEDNDIVKGETSVQEIVKNVMISNINEVPLRNLRIVSKNNEIKERKLNDSKSKNIRSDFEEDKSSDEEEDIEDHKKGKTTSFENSIKDKNTITLKASKTRMTPKKLNDSKKNIRSDLEEDSSSDEEDDIDDYEEGKTTTFDNSIEDKNTITLKASKTRLTLKNSKATLGLNKNTKITQTCVKKLKRNILSESEEEDRSEGNEESEFMEVNDFHESKSSPVKENNEKPTRKLRSRMNYNANKKCTDNSVENSKRSISLGLGDTSDEDSEESETKEVSDIFKGKTSRQETVKHIMTSKIIEAPSRNLKIASKNNERKLNDTKGKQNKRPDSEEDNSNDEGDENSKTKKTNVFLRGKKSIEFKTDKKSIVDYEKNKINNDVVFEMFKKNISFESDEEDINDEGDKGKVNEEKMTKSNVDVDKKILVNETKRREGILSKPKKKDTTGEGGKTNVVVESKKAVTQVLKYKRLSELKDNYICVNAFGIIKNILQEETESRIYKCRVAVEIIDPSQYDPPFRILLFLPQNNLESLKKNMEINQIIEVIGMKVENFRGSISGRVFTDTSIELYDSDTGRNIEWRKNPRSFQLSETETIESLISWNKKKASVQNLESIDIQEQKKTSGSDSIAKANLATKKPSQKLLTDSSEKLLKIEPKLDLYNVLDGIVFKKDIDMVRNEKVKISVLSDFKDIKESMKFNMIFQVVNIHQYNEINLDIIQVKDGTLCPLPVLNIPLENNWSSVKNSILKSPKFIQNSSILDLMCFKSKPTLSKMEVGKCYLLRSMMAVKTRLSAFTKEKDGYLMCVENTDCEARESFRVKAVELLRDPNEGTPTNVNAKDTEIVKSLLPSSEDSVDRAMCDLSLLTAQHIIKEKQKDNILKRTDLASPGSKTPSLIDLDHTDGINTDIPSSIAREIDSMIQEESAFGLPVTLSEDIHLRNTGSDPSYSQFINHVNKRSLIFKTSTQTCEVVQPVCTLSCNNSNKTNANTNIENADSIAVHENYLALTSDCTKLSDIRSENKDKPKFVKINSNSSQGDLEDDLHSDAGSESILSHRCRDRCLKDSNLIDGSVISGIFEQNKNFRKENTSFEKDMNRIKENQEIEVENVSSCESSDSDIKVIKVNTPLSEGIIKASKSKNNSSTKNFQKSSDTAKSPSNNMKMLSDCFKDPNFRLPSRNIYTSKNNTEESSYMEKTEEDAEFESGVITSVIDFPDLPICSSSTFLELKATNRHSYTVIPLRLLPELDDAWEEKCVQCVCKNCNKIFILSDLEKLPRNVNDSWPGENVPVCLTSRCNNRHIGINDAHFQFEMELNLVKFKLTLPAILDSYSAETFLGCSLLEFLRSAAKKTEARSRLRHLFCQNDTNSSNNIYHFTLWRKNIFDPNSGPLFVKRIELA